MCIPQREELLPHPAGLIGVAREYTPSVQYQRLSAMLRVGCVTEQILLGLLRAREWKDVV
jgi:hypothetical protein